MMELDTAQPNTTRDLASLLTQCAKLKRRLAEHVWTRFGDDLRPLLLRHSRGSKCVTEIDITLVTNDFIHTFKGDNGETVIDSFVANSPGLSDSDRRIVLGWKESVIGVFEVKEWRGQVLHIHNLVDDLDYCAVANEPSDETRQRLGTAGFIYSRLDQLGDYWMFSGLQSLLNASERRTAFGMAARLAQQCPAFFFRNPAHLEQGRTQDRALYERFIAQFGAPWVVGTRVEVERQWRDFALAKVVGADREKLEKTLCLPKKLYSTETVGMIADPQAGMYFVEDFGRFLDALETPSVALEPRNREVVLGYLESAGVAPSVFSLCAEHRPAQLNAMLAVALGRPGFDWLRDGDGVVRERNPEYLEAARFPSSLPMNNDLADGLRALSETAARALSSESSPRSAGTTQTAEERRRRERQRARAARKKNRR